MRRRTPVVRANGNDSKFRYLTCTDWIEHSFRALHFSTKYLFLSKILLVMFLLMIVLWVQMKARSFIHDQFIKERSMYDRSGVKEITNKLVCQQWVDSQNLGNRNPFAHEKMILFSTLAQYWDLGSCSTLENGDLQRSIVHAEPYNKTCINFLIILRGVFNCLD